MHTSITHTQIKLMHTPNRHTHQLDIKIKQTHHTHQSDPQISETQRSIKDTSIRHKAQTHTSPRHKDQSDTHINDTQRSCRSTHQAVSSREKILKRKTTVSTLDVIYIWLQNTLLTQTSILCSEHRNITKNGSLGKWWQLLCFDVAIYLEREELGTYSA